jgi:Tfp pilus assembly protein PilO
MSLWQRILGEKRGLVTAVAVILVVDIGLYAFAVYPYANKVEQSELRMATAGGQLNDVTGAYAEASEAVSSKSLADNQLERFYNDVLPRDLAEARNLLSPYLDNLSADMNLVLERRSSVSEKVRDSPLTNLSTTMVLAGEYEDIREFIYEMETAPEFILIESVVLGQRNGSDDELVLTLGVSTYFWEGPDEAS